MIHKTPKETTPNLYESDGVISIRVLDAPQRYPVHDSHQMVVFRFTPKPHTRIRQLDKGIIEFMPTNQDVGAFLKAFDQANGKFPLSSGLPLKNKPIERKRYHERKNQRRVSNRRFAQRRFNRENRRH